MRWIIPFKIIILITVYFGMILPLPFADFQSKKAAAAQWYDRMPQNGQYTPELPIGERAIPQDFRDINGPAEGLDTAVPENDSEQPSAEENAQPDQAGTPGQSQYNDNKATAGQETNNQAPRLFYYVAALLLMAIPLAIILRRRFRKSH